MSGKSYEELEAENIELHDRLAQRNACLRDVSKKALAIVDEVCAEMAYTGPIRNKEGR